MKLVRRFTRCVRTSRRHVFENIMDLDHVCVVHRRWFRNLRIRTWTPERVDYRLQARFHGVKEEIEVRGEVVGADSYWYEFNGLLARIRVDGHLEGADGDLTLGETITYEHSWTLWPIFLLLAPLLRRQKEDILRDDTRLLERVYALEASGFRRSVDAGRPRVVVFGGTGFFGRLVVKDLLARTAATIGVVSRNPAPVDFAPHETRVHAWIADLKEPDAVRRVVRGAALCINAAGPFQGMPLHILEACIDEKVPYIDVADDRDFVARAYALAPRIRAAGIPAFVGCSVVPGISALLTQMALEDVPKAETIRICITPGTRHVRGDGSFACLLDTVGARFHAPRDGQPSEVVGWSEGARFEFPPSIGGRVGYRVVDIADHFTLPHWFGTRTVEFRIGAELDVLNRLLSIYRVTKPLLGSSIGRRLLPLLRAAVSAASVFGSARGAMLAEVSGSGRTTTLCIHHASAGHIIPAVLPAIAAEMVLAGEAPPAGIVPLPDWIAPQRFADALRARGVELSRRREDGAWESWRSTSAVRT